MRSSLALKSYAQIDVRARVEEQSPERLIALLLEKGCTLVRQAIASLEKNNSAGFQEATTKAVELVVALRGLLDYENGGSVAEKLGATYGSIAASLFRTKTTKSVSDLEKLYQALSELRGAWDQIS